MEETKARSYRSSSLYGELLSSANNDDKLCIEDKIKLKSSLTNT